jgi:23S rRNA (adenine2503-C2)-methyltransferase
MVKTNIFGLSDDEIFSLIKDWGFSYSHAVSISNCLYKKKVTDISQFSKIPKRLKLQLTETATICTIAPVSHEVSADKTIKYLFRTATDKEFETVYIPDGKRNTVCVSAQSGCRMGCPFCLTARYGFRGNLSAGEIVNQIISIPDTGKITHVVFMGMGEPMDNLENVLKACEIITAEWGLAISPRNVTVSTIGMIPGVDKFLLNSDCNLTLSLHSPFPAERKLIVPAEFHYPVQNVIDLMKNFPLYKKRRLSVAYMMIKDLNDTDHHLDELKRLFLNTKIRVNILPYHPAGDNSGESSSEERMQYFKHNLVISGISASIRKSRGADISAACGLLANSLSIATGIHPDSHLMF